MSLEQLGMLLVGGALFFFPEPITSIAGIVLIFAAFGMKDAAPVGGA